MTIEEARQLLAVIAVYDLRVDRSDVSVRMWAHSLGDLGLAACVDAVHAHYTRSLTPEEEPPSLRPGHVRGAIGRARRPELSPYRAEPRPELGSGRAGMATLREALAELERVGLRPPAGLVEKAAGT